MKTLTLKILALCLGLLVTLPTSGRTAGPDTEPLRVVVSILPQVWFAQQIGGPEVQVSVLVGPGHSPATFDPTPRQLAELQDADLFISAGVPFEKGLVPRVQALPNGPTLVGPEPGEGQDHEGHDHHGHHHHPDELDPHTWLDPMQAVASAQEMATAFGQFRPALAQLFADRAQALETRLAKLDQEIRNQLAPHAGRRFFVFHPAFGHFAEAYGLEQVAVEDQGHEPGPRQLARVINQAKADGATAIVVQPQFSEKAAGTVARAAGLQVINLDPLSDDYENNLRHIARTLVRSFTTAGEESP
jgi:zinc transport system substrate-binding protein